MTSAALSPGRAAFAALALLLVCWVGANPPGLSPDEPAHYRRAVGLAFGVVLGPEVAYRGAPVVSASQLAWLNRTTRAVPVPEHLAGCGIFRLQIAGRCPVGAREGSSHDPLPAGHEPTYVGTYPPFAYLLPALTIRLADAAGLAATGALLAARAATAALCAGLLAAAGAVRRRDADDPLGLVGLAALAIAVTPLAAFLFVQPSGSGTEVAAAIATAAALLAVTRSAPAPRVAVGTLCVAGLVLATSRSTGPLFVAEIVLLVALLRGRSAVTALRNRETSIALCVVGAACVASVTWQFAVEPSPARTVGSVLAAVPSALTHLDTVLLQTAGVLGWRDVPVPGAAQAIWLLVAGAAIWLALQTGNRRELWTLTVGGALVIGTAVLIDAAVIVPTSADFDMQGRYVLALTVVLPLLAAEVVGRHAARVRRVLGRPAVAVAGPVLAATAALHACALAVNSAHYATDPVFGREIPGGWLPPGGPLPWVGLVAVAAVCVAEATRRPRVRPRHSAPAGRALSGIGRGR